MRRRGRSAGVLRSLPLVTLGVLLTLMLAWNLSFYEDVYLDRTAAAAHRDDAAGPNGDPNAEMVGGTAGGTAGVPGPGGDVDVDRPVGEIRPASVVAPRDSEVRVQEGERERIGPERAEQLLDAPELGRRRVDAAEPVVEPILLDYPNGVVRVKGRRVNGLREGLWEENYEHGQRLSTGAYEADLREGPWTFYFENGQRRHEGSYSAGRKQGRWQEWNLEGQLVREGSYEAGELTGSWRQWYTNGRVMEAGQYVEGRRTGFWEFYTFEGERAPRTSFYRKGRPVDRE